MRTRLTAAVLAVALAPIVARADDDNPYRNTKVGDYATYSLNMKLGELAITGTLTTTVTAKTDKEATVKATGKINGMDIPAQEQKVDLTKPFDPSKLANLPQGTDAKVEKVKEGKEKIKVLGKEFDTTWTTYKVDAKANGLDIKAEVKAWMSKEITLSLAKLEANAEVAGMKVQMTLEVTETGNKK